MSATGNPCPEGQGGCQLGAIFPSSAGLKAERASWPSADELAEMSRHDQEAWERRCAEVEAAEVARRLDEPAKETGQP